MACQGQAASCDSVIASVRDACCAGVDCDSDGFPHEHETSNKFYKEMMNNTDEEEGGIFHQAEKAQTMFPGPPEQEGCTVEELKEEEKIPESK